MELIDISRPLSVQTAVWPGDRQVDTSWTQSIRDGDVVNVGAIETSLHAGTHADAPFHFDASGVTIDQLPLQSYIGAASVIEVGSADAISVDVLEATDIPITPRLLFRSKCSALSSSEWPASYPVISHNAVAWLDAHDVVLVGTDAPSVDAQNSTSLPTHHALHECQIAILEQLDLSRAEPGQYHMVAFPLRLTGMDASPVRAVLMRDI
jgi:arylformamidase